MSDEIKSGPPPDPPPAPAEPKSAELCPHCGARRITSAQDQCWLCHGTLPPYEGQLPMGRVARTEGNAVLIFLGVLILVVAAVLIIEAPGIAAVVGILAVPALIRSVVKTEREKDLGQSLSGLEKWGIFFSSLGAVALMGLGAAIAFFATCFTVCLGVGLVGSSGGFGSLNALLAISVTGGSIIGVLVFGRLYYKFWPRNKR